MPVQNVLHSHDFTGPEIRSDGGGEHEMADATNGEV